MSKNVLKEYFVSLGGMVDKESFGKINQTLEDIRSLIVKLSSELLAYRKSVTDAGNQTEETARQIDDSTKATDDNTQSAKENAKATSKQGDAVEELGEKVKKTTNEMAPLTGVMNGLKIVTIKSMIDIGKQVWEVSKGPLQALYKSFKKVDKTNTFKAVEKDVKRFKKTAETALQWVSHHVLSMVEGPMRRFRNTFSDLNKNMKVNLPSWTKMIALVIAAVIRGADVVMRLAGRIVDAINRIPAPIRNILGAFIALGLIVKSGPVGWIITGIAAIILLLDDFFTYLDGGESKFGDFWKVAVDAFDKVKGGIDKLQEIGLIKPLIYGIITAITILTRDKVISRIKGLADAAKRVATFFSLGNIKTLLIAAAIGALVGVIIWCVQHWDFLKEKVKEVCDKLSEWWEGVRAAFDEKMASISKKAEEINAAVEKFFSDCVEAVKGFFEGIGTWFANRYNEIKNAFSGVDTWFKEKFDLAKEKVHAAFEGIAGWFSAKGSAIKSVFIGIPGWFSRKFESAKEKVHAAFDSIGEWFKGKYADITGAFASIPGWFYGKFRSAKQKVTSTFANIGDWFQGKYNAITGVFSGVSDWFSEKFGAAKTAIDTAFSPVTETISGIWSTIQGVFNGEITLKSLVEGAVNGAKETLTGWIDDLINIGPQFISNIATGIENAKQALWDKISGIFGWVGKLFPHSDAEEGPFADLSKSGSALIDTFGDGAAAQQESFGTKLTGVLSGAWNAAKNALGDAWNWFVGLFSKSSDEADEEMDDFDETAGKHKDSVVSAFDGMDTDIGDEFTSAAQLAMSAWDGVAEYFAGVASDIRESILSAAAQVTFTTPTQVKQHAYGGITTQPTLSTLSEDGGKEYIIPINKPKRALELMMGAAQDLMGSLGGAGGSERMMRSDSQVVKQDIKNTVTAPATINIYESNNPKTTAQEVNNRFEEHIYDSTKGVFSS